MRISQDLRTGALAKAVDSKIDQCMHEQISFIETTLQQNKHGNYVVKGLSADSLEHLLKSLLPMIRLSNDKFLIGTSVKTVQIQSEKLLVMVGGGAIVLDKYWRQVVVTETIKLNKMIASSKQSVSKVVQGLLESAGAHALDIADFMKGSKELDILFSQQTFVLKKWSLR